MISLILCIFIIIVLSGCGTKNNAYQPTSYTTEGETKNGYSTSVTRGGTKTSLSDGGVEYEVTDGRLIIKGSGTVTKEAIDSLLPEYNIVNFFSPDGAFDIADDAFSGLKNITDISMGSFVDNIGARAFKGCSMPVVLLDENIKTIGENAFEDCCIDIVLIRNTEIYKNYNTKDDFGKVGANASAIYVGKMVVLDSYYGDYSTSGSDAGDYLNDNGAFEYIAENTQQKGNFTKTANFNQAFGEFGFLRVFDNETPEGSHSYYSKIDNEYITFERFWSGGTFEYHISSDYWKDKGRDITFYTTDYLSDNPSGETSCAECAKSGYSVCQGHECGICEGAGSITCSGCGGSGIDPMNKYTNYKCIVCGGSKVQICPNCEGARKVFNNKF